MAELIAGRQWRQAASPDGVICQVAQLAPRALIDDALAKRTDGA